MKIPRLTFYFSIFMLIGMMGLIYVHESVHVQIYKSYGIESRISFFPNPKATAERPCEATNCKLMNNLNEVIGYPLYIFYALFAISFLFILLLLESKFMGG